MQKGSRDVVPPRDEVTVSHVALGTPPPQIHGYLQAFSGEDAEKSATKLTNATRGWSQRSQVGAIYILPIAEPTADTQAVSCFSNRCNVQ